MSRHEAAKELAGDLLADVELKRLKASEIVLKAGRLARLVGHDDLSAFLSLERNGYFEPGFDPVWLQRSGRWYDSSREKFYQYPIAQMEASMEAAQVALDALRGGGNYSGEYASIAGREHDGKIAGYARTVSTNAGICSQVITTTYTMVAEIYHELLFSELQATLFSSTQAAVDGALAEASGSSLEKIERISERLRDGDPESVSQALTTCRRLIDSSANFLFPPQDAEYVIGSQGLKVGGSNVLNRLSAFVHQQGASPGRRDRLRRSLSDLYERCSAGTHAEVGVDEARFLFLQTYMLLGEVMSLKVAGSPEPVDQE